MKINLLNLKNVDRLLKNMIGLGLFLYILSIFSLIFILNFRFSYDIGNLLFAFGLFFFFNFVGLILILFGCADIISKYKDELIKLNAYKLIIDQDKSDLFKKINKLEHQNISLNDYNKQLEEKYKYLKLKWENI